MNRNFLYAVVGALVVAVAVLGYQSYKASQQSSGVTISVGEDGLSITNTE